MDKRKSTKFRKTAIAALCALSVTCTGLAAACAENEKPKDSSPSTQTQREDNQLLKNGNFEYSVVPEKAVHLIKNVTNWTKAGDSSGVMSGIIDTTPEAWDKLDSPDLKGTLDYNNDLSSSDPDYNDLHVDYNGMDAEDILYADSYAAGFENDADVLDTDDIIAVHGTYKDFMGVEGDDENGYTFTYNGKTVPVYASDDENSREFFYDPDFTKPLRYTRIANPETHLGEFSEKDGKFYLGETEIFKDDKDNYFLDEEHENPVGNVLMIHNYPTNRKYNGIEQHYTSQTITLEANTAAEISVWVKTSDLKFDKGYSQFEDENRGAYIQVTQSVASTTVDSFKIRAINTEKIINDAENVKITLPDGVSSNGWLNYTIYVNACDFASSTISIVLGLGDSNTTQKLTGYAFFDDVEVKKFIDLNDEGCTYDKNKATIEQAEHSSYCTLTSEEDDKIFVADRETRSGDSVRYSDRFHYLIDLASENVEGSSEKTEIPFKNDGLTATVALTSEKSASDGKLYASALTNEANVNGLTKNDKDNYVLTDSMKQANGRPTFNDLIGIYGASKTQFTSADFANTNNPDFRDLSARLNSALTGENGLDALKNVSKGNGDMLVMLSAYGAAYTASFQNSGAADKIFTVEGKVGENSQNHKIISFWVKTSDLGGGTAATLKLIDVNDEDNFATFTIDTTNKKTNIGDNKDIYRGWVQCFFFVNNETEEAKDFKLEFSFGNTSIADTALTSYVAGWAAIADMQVLDVKDDVFKLCSDDSYAKTLSFNEEDEKTGAAFDAANGMSDVKKGVAVPSTYNGVNGGSSFVTDKLFGDDYDSQNNSKNAVTGLINRNGFKDTAYDSVRDTILKAFGLDSYTDAEAAWNEVFGEDCYQPLIIVDSVRAYHDRADANEENFRDYYIKKDDVTFEKVSPDAEFDENETYYSEEQLVKNYGYIGASSSVSSDNCQTVSVRVKVSGDAVAYVYLVDPDTREVMKYGTPEYTFFYDTEGNVLSKEYDDGWTDAEHLDAIVYTLRDDGLYEDKDGKIFANIYNLTTRFKYAKFESNTFYKKVGENQYEQVKYDDLQDGELYYYDDNGTYKLASHYLVAGVQRVYEYDAETEKYYYVTGGERGVEVNAFDTSYARYDFAGVSALPEYSVKIENTNGKWVTVNFVIKTGNLAKSYRLELWSGKRDETGVVEGDTPNQQTGGAVAFDVSSYSITSSNYSTVLSQYENAIKEIYTKLILAKNAEKLTDEVVTLDDYVKVLDEIGLKTSDDYATVMNEIGMTEKERTTALNILKNYSAAYYTYTFYDSADFVPFNKTTASEGQTGYDYKVTDYSETLAYFSTFDESADSYNIFADYSAIDQSVSLNETDSDTPEEENPSNGATNDGSNWLLITSIIFAIVMIFALVAVLVRYLAKKFGAKRRQRRLQKNNYKQRQRAMRRYRIAPAESGEETDKGDNKDGANVPAEPAPENTETPVIPAEPASENTETPDAPAEPAPENTETPATPAEPAPENTETPETADDKKDE